jgi:hypothetical protein
MYSKDRRNGRFLAADPSFEGGGDAYANSSSLGTGSEACERTIVHRRRHMYLLGAKIDTQRLRLVAPTVKLRRR